MKSHNPTPSQRPAIRLDALSFLLLLSVGVALLTPRSLLTSLGYLAVILGSALISRPRKNPTALTLKTARIRVPGAEAGKLFDPLRRNMVALRALLSKLKQWLSSKTRAAQVERKTGTARPTGRLSQGLLYSERRRPNTFVLYRILGNDLPPRHQKGQTLRNVKYILEHEPSFRGVEKRWVVNRIVNAQIEQEIIELLTANDQDFIRIPFSPADFDQVDWCFESLPSPNFLYSARFQSLDPEQRQRCISSLYRKKILYVMNNNGARNTALFEGKAVAEWVMPWDGNCFLTDDAFLEIEKRMRLEEEKPYAIVPMVRLLSLEDLVTRPLSLEATEEPQIIFHSSSAETFNEDFPYGRRPKVELLWRLGVQGTWDTWTDDPWDLRRPKKALRSGAAKSVSRVYRLPSGAPHLETSAVGVIKSRGLARTEATLNLIDSLSNREPSSPVNFGFYSWERLEEIRNARLEPGGEPGNTPVADVLNIAKDAMLATPVSVVDKTTIAPSGNRQDYWHTAPYWWPNPNKIDGTPFIQKDGERFPGTELYEPGSEAFDRSNLQRTFEFVTALSLAAHVTEEKDYSTKAVAMIRSWFLDPLTKMNPHLRFAQVRKGHNRDEGSGTGIIEFGDVYFFLDAVKLLEHNGALTPLDSAQLKSWFTDYLEWMLTSAQGLHEMTSPNNHGTWFDVQALSIGSYLGRKEVVREAALRVLSRFHVQFDVGGLQPEEFKRTNSRHYFFYNLQASLLAIQLIRRHFLSAVDTSKDPYNRVLRGVEYAASTTRADWPYQQIEPFDEARVIPLTFLADSLFGANRTELDTQARNYRYDCHHGVPLFWRLGLPPVFGTN